tara:strand:+ start:756 stop:1016 length:261 start_codon:yes stop_codon:yes gene_type:complete
MKYNSILRELSERLLRLFPPSDSLKGQLKSKIDSTLKSAFEEFGLLTQEDFDQQLRALNRAQARVDELEKTLDQLESEINKRKEIK